MKKVLYHQENREPQEFVVLKERADGTVDIGPNDGPAVVTKCPITATPTPGSCTLVTEPEAPKQ